MLLYLKEGNEGIVGLFGYMYEVEFVVDSY